MAVSSSSINDIDLNVSFSLSITSDEKPDVPTDHLDEPAIDSNVLVVPPDVWHPNFTIDNLPCDQALLIDKSDIDAVNDSLAFSIQGAVSTSDLARRLHVRNEEIKFLRDQILEKSNWGITTTAQILQAKAHGIEAGKYSA
jgi:hypothetical protein